MIPGTIPGMDGMLLTIVMATIAGTTGDGAGIIIPLGGIAGAILYIITILIMAAFIVLVSTTISIAMAATEWAATSVATGMFPVMGISGPTAHVIIHLATPGVTSRVRATHHVPRELQRVQTVLLLVPTEAHHV